MCTPINGQCNYELSVDVYGKATYNRNGAGDSSLKVYQNKFRTTHFDTLVYLVKTLFCNSTFKFLYNFQFCIFCKHGFNTGCVKAYLKYCCGLVAFSLYNCSLTENFMLNSCSGYKLT